MSVRSVVLGGGIAALFIGCLFPSFDDLKKNDAAAETPADDDDNNTSSGGRRDAGSASSGSSGDGTSTSSTSGDPGTSSGTADTGAPDTSTPAPKTIACDGQTCDVNTQVCCDNGFGQTGCRPKGSSCTWTFECDDFTDCPEGQRCCLSSLTVRCAASCSNGPEICNTGKTCKTGTCGGELSGPPDVNVRECQ